MIQNKQTIIKDGKEMIIERTDVGCYQFSGYPIFGTYDITSFEGQPLKVEIKTFEDDKQT